MSEPLRLIFRESNAPDREEIDFVVDDGNDNIAWVWGKRDNYQVECNHAVTDKMGGKEYCVVCGEALELEQPTTDNDGGLIGRYVKYVATEEHHA